MEDKLEIAFKKFREILNGKFGALNINKPYLRIYKIIVRLLFIASVFLAIRLFCEAAEIATNFINALKWGI